MTYTLQALIRLYQLTLSPFIGQQCRFEPSCSRYASQAIAEHGPLKGCWLALRRIGRCQPWAKVGFDPVPPLCCNKHANNKSKQTISKVSL